MLLDIHRHAKTGNTAFKVVRNLFHNQTGEIEVHKLYSVGLHPWHVNEESLQSDLEMIRRISDHPQIIAIGEAGLDKAINTPYSTQLKAFWEQILIAGSVGKPMIIHCVRAYNELIELRSETKDMRPWIIHWFNSNVEMGLQLIGKDFYLSFGHMLFNEQSKAYRAFTKLPLDRIFLETDDTGYSIHDVYQKAALLRGISVEDLEMQIILNFKQCFNIEL